MSLSVSARELIDEAVTRLMDDGWTKGSLVDRQDDGTFRYCAAGALLVCAGAEPIQRFKVWTLDLTGLYSTHTEGDTLYIDRTPELELYKEICQEFQQVHGVSLFRGNDECESWDDIVMALMLLQSDD